jgi:AcrR family transcriptional regulator
MADIAEACGVAVGSVYYHYPDKRALLLALMDDLLERTSQIQTADLPFDVFLGPKPRQDIDKWLRRSYEGLKKRPSAYLVLLGLAESDPELRRRRLAIDQLAIDRLSSMIARGQEQGLFRKGDDPAASAFMIHHAIEMAVTQLLVRGGKAGGVDPVLGALSKMICRYLLEDEHP